jgi:hypothetical protein
MCAYIMGSHGAYINTLRTGDANLRLYAYKQFKYPVPNVLIKAKIISFFLKYQFQVNIFLKSVTQPHLNDHLTWVLDKLEMYIKFT